MSLKDIELGASITNKNLQYQTHYGKDQFKNNSIEYSPFIRYKLNPKFALKIGYDCGNKFNKTT